MKLLLNLGRPKDVLIGVMGVTGSGKSSFISLLANQRVEVGHGLKSCKHRPLRKADIWKSVPLNYHSTGTKAVGVYFYEVSPDQTIYLIDTPGFDDTDKTDTMVLKEIAQWLKVTFEQKILLNGIIYIHQISADRMTGSAKKNIMMFKSLCGPDAMKNVMLVTSMWDQVPVKVAEQREKELMETEEFWGWMHNRGSIIRRHHNTHSSAEAIVQEMVQMSGKAPVKLSLQEEMVNKGRTLEETGAARTLEGEWTAEKARLQEQLVELKEQMESAIRQKDADAQEILADQQREHRERILSLEDQSRQMKEGLDDMSDVLVKKMVEDAMIKMMQNTIRNALAKSTEQQRLAEAEAQREKKRKCIVM